MLLKAHFFYKFAPSKKRVATKLNVGLFKYKIKETTRVVDGNEESTNKSESHRRKLHSFLAEYHTNSNAKLGKA